MSSMPRQETTTPAASAPGWTFAITSTALFMTALDNLVVTTALPHDPARTCTPRSAGSNGRSRLHAHFRRPPADGFEPRRAFWAPADVPGRPRDLYPWLGGRRARSSIGSWSPPVLCRDRWRDRHAPDTHAARRCVARRTAGPRSRCLGRHRRPGRGQRTSGRRGDSRMGVVAVDLLAERPIGLVLLPLAYARLEESRGTARRLDLPGLLWPRRACSASSSAWCAARAWAGRRPR